MSPYIKNLSLNHYPWLKKNSFDAPVIISSRARIARNVEGYNFPEKADSDMRSELVDTVFEALEKLPLRKKVQKTEIDNLSERAKKILLERKILSVETLFGLDCGIVFDEKEKFSILLNKEDHIHIQALKPGFQVAKCWQICEKVEEQLSRGLKFSFSNDLGYLTSCPVNVGTGLKLSVYVDLTGTVLLEQMPAIIQATKVLGYKISGENGEDGDYKGTRFLIASNRTLGVSELDALEQFEQFVKEIVYVENQARRKIFADFPKRLLNHVSRSLGFLKNSWILSENEAYDHLMVLRTGVLMGVFEKVDLEMVNDLIICSGDAHFQNVVSEELLPEEMDSARASIFKEKLSFK